MVADIATYEPWSVRRKSNSPVEQELGSTELDRHDIEIFVRSDILGLSTLYSEQDRLEVIFASHRYRGRLVRPTPKVSERNAESLPLNVVASVKEKFDQLIVPLMTVMALVASALAIYKGFVNSNIAFETALFIVPGIIFLAAIYAISKDYEK
jgi:hypothetical protein